MVGTGKALVFLQEDEILEINKRLIEEFGGFYTHRDRNLANPGSLRYILEAIQGSFFGVEPYPTTIEKAAALAWQIITAHVFHDGNKRTGMEACRLFLELNGLAMRVDMEVVEVALRVAQSELEFSGFVRWLEQRTLEIS
jgi:death-on-curing protein